MSSRAALSAVYRSLGMRWLLLSAASMWPATYQDVWLTTQPVGRGRCSEVPGTTARCHHGPMPPAPSGWWPQPSDVAEQRGPVVHALFRLSRKNRAMVGDALRPLGLYPGQE